MANSSFKITRALPGNVISGSLAVAGLLGQFVSIKDNAAAAGITSASDNPLFELATNRRGYMLEREVQNVTAIDLAQLVFGNAKLTPVLVNNPVTARQVQECEYEGTDYLVLTSTGAISTTTPLRSKLTTASGKLAVLTAPSNVEKEVTHAGSNGAGPVTTVGTAVGDVVVAAFDITDGTDVTSSFESTVTVAGQIQQSAATDLHLKTIRFDYYTPVAQETVGLLAGFLQCEDTVNNTVRILVEFIS